MRTSALQSRNSWIRWLRMCISIGAVGFFATIMIAASQGAQRYRILFRFCNGSGGGTPFGGLVLDRAGSLYGTTTSGGAFGDGTIFKVSPTGVESTLYSFTGLRDGINSYSPMILDSAGNLYGTTLEGGLARGGTVFELDTTGHKTILHNFDPAIGDGYNPGSLVFDARGNLYGVTSYGGLQDQGLIFELVNSGGSWTENILYLFAGASDGGHPVGGLVFDSSGNLYGVTQGGGAFKGGTIFELNSTGVKTILHNFSTGDGTYPIAGLVRDPAGNLYGTAAMGGSMNNGTVFKLDSAGTFSVLYKFRGQSDGGSPYSPLVLDPTGNLYGTTNGGGFSPCDGLPYQCGVVFKIDTTGRETVLHIFKGTTDGAFTWSGLARDQSGRLYGTSLEGGGNGCQTVGCGTVYELLP